MLSFLLRREGEDLKFSLGFLRTGLFVTECLEEHPLPSEILEPNKPLEKQNTIKEGNIHIILVRQCVLRYP